MQLRLWGFRASPFAGRVRSALIEKGIEGVELVEVHPTKRPARLKELNPNGRVPVLEVDGVPLRESLNICDWLEDAYPEPALWPSDPTVRAYARGLALWLDVDLTQPFFLGMRHTAFGIPEGEPEDAAERCFARVPRGWPKLEKLLAAHDGPWLLGDTFTFADLAGQPLAVRVAEWRPELVPDAAEFPRTTAWLAALRERPSAAGIDQKGTRADELGFV